MVQLEEVEDEEFVTNEKFEDDDDFTDTDSSLSEDEILEPTDLSESFSERLAALRDMVPPAKRRRIVSGFESVTNFVKGTAWFGAKGIWVLSTSVLLLGVPFALAVAEEGQIVAMEREQEQRQMGNELLTPSNAGQQDGRLS